MSGSSVKATRTVEPRTPPRRFAYASCVRSMKRCVVPRSITEGYFAGPLGKGRVRTSSLPSFAHVISRRVNVSFGSDATTCPQAPPDGQPPSS